MPITSADLKVYRSAVVNDGDTNGGVMSAVQVVDGAINNLFKSAQGSERVAGSEKYRKAFFKNANDDDLTLLTPYLMLSRPTPGDDVMYIFPATQTDTQDDLTGTERLYGAGKLYANANAGSASIQVLVDEVDSNTTLFQDGDTIAVSNKAHFSDDAGDFEYAVIDGDPTYIGNVATITLAATLINSYTTADTYVASCIELADLKGSISNFSKTSVGGTYDSSKILPDNIGSVEQTWTVTFTGATAYNITGDTLGAVGSGNISGGAAPNNPNFTKPYFTLQAAGFGGTWANGNTIVFKTHPSAAPFWVKRVVPAGSAVTSNNAARVALAGETA